MTFSSLLCMWYLWILTKAIMVLCLLSHPITNKAYVELKGGKTVHTYLQSICCKVSCTTQHAGVVSFVYNTTCWSNFVKFSSVISVFDFSVVKDSKEGPCFCRIQAQLWALLRRRDKRYTLKFALGESMAIQGS